MPWVTVTHYDRRDVVIETTSDFYSLPDDALEEYDAAVTEAMLVRGADSSDFKQHGWRRTTVSLPNGNATTIEMDY